MDGLFKAVVMQDEDVSLKASQCISEVVNVGYDYIQEYVQTVGELTCSLID